MKLTNLSTHKTKAKRFAKIFENRFGTRVNLSKMTPKTAIKIVNRLEESMALVRNSHGIHTAEQNPRYMESLLLKEGLDDWLHARLCIAHQRKLTEGEIEQAEAVLAAKDFVDRLQKMLEDVGRILNEDLPPLTDVIRDQIGMEQADQYNATATQALGAVQSSLSQSRGEMDSAARMLSGEQPQQMSMSEPEMDTEPEMEPEMSDEFASSDAEIGGDSEMGRELR